MIRRTLMQRNRELVDFEVDPVTGDARVIDSSAEGDELLASVRPGLQDRGEALSALVGRRAISPLREDKDDVLAAFGAKSPVDLALKGHGLSLSDQFWYRAPGGAERWEDVNFFDNEWDPGFGAAVLRRDYAGLASCSLHTPDVTTCGHAVKTWERGDDGILLIKRALLPNGDDLIGVKLASDLCDRLFDEGCYVPLDIVERYGNPCSASPHMLASDEELAEGDRLCVMAGMRGWPGKGDGDRMSAELLQSLFEAYAAVGVSGASAHIARAASFFCLAITLDFHSGNFGIIRKVGTDAWRAAPLFDFEGAFGFPDDAGKYSAFLANPSLAKLFCASIFSFLDSSWDWSWYDPQVLEGFEERIVEALALCANMLPGHAELVADLFVMQREYVNRVASAQSA